MIKAPNSNPRGSLFALISILVLFGQVGPDLRAEELAPGAADQTATVKPGTWRSSTLLWGRTAARWSGRFILPVSLTVTSVEAGQYQSVKADERLFAFSSPELTYMFSRLALEKARFDQAKRRQKFYETGKAKDVTTAEVKFEANQEVLATQEAFDKAWSSLSETLAALGHKTNLQDVLTRLSQAPAEKVSDAFSTVRSRTAVYISESAVSVGTTLQKGAMAYRFQDISSVFVDVPDIGAVMSTDGKGDVALEAAGGWQPLKLIGTAPETDRATGLPIRRFTIDNIDRGLLGGQWAQIRVQGPVRSAFWVPSAAVVDRKGKSYCIVAKSGRQTPIAVTVGATEHGMTPVLSGLSAGDKVVTTGAYELLYKDLNVLLQQAD